jgi:hypothetical protein
MPNGVEDHPELPVVLLLQRLQPLSQIGMGSKKPPQSDEGSHDLDIHLDGTGAVQDAGEHGDPLLRES